MAVLLSVCSLAISDPPDSSLAILGILSVSTAISINCFIPNYIGFTPHRFLCPRFWSQNGIENKSLNFLWFKRKSKCWETHLPRRNIKSVISKLVCLLTRLRTGFIFFKARASYNLKTIWIWWYRG